MAIRVVDINCDMGEGFGQWRSGEADDADLLEFVSSANIATGFHAGDPNLMDRTVRMAAERGIGIGAHPGYRDLQGFGRRRISGDSGEIVNDIVYQVGALREFTRRHGTRLQHVKPHGAMYMDIAASETLSRAVVDAMRKVAPDAILLCMGVSETYRIAREAGQPVAREFYADREYDRSGAIVFTRRPQRLDASEVADKVLRACREQKVRTVEGDDIDIDFESICFHSDTPGAAALAARMRRRLIDEGIRILPLSELPL